MLSNAQELDNLLDVLNQENIPDMTFDQCMQKFSKHFGKPDWFKACSTLCYLIEAQMLSKSQRIVAFYILYEVYHHENVHMTPFEAVVYSSLQACAQANQTIKEQKPENSGGRGAPPLSQALQGQSYVHVNDLSGVSSNIVNQSSGTTTLLNEAGSCSISPDAHFRAEYKLLTDFLISVPKIKQEKVSTFIKNAECPKPIENLQGFIQNYQDAIPKVSGLKGVALSGVLRDLPENEFSRFTQHGVDENTAYDGNPEIGVISSRDIDLEEMDPHYFVPNFVRPMPEAEEDPDLDATEGGMHDIAEDAMFLIPGMLPEPYWDFNMATDQLNYAQMKKYLNRACKTALTKAESNILQKSLAADKEMVFHIDMCPAKLPDLVTHNPDIAKDILVYMTNSHEIPQYYDMLNQMKLSISLLQVFDGVQHNVEFPKEFTLLFVKNCMQQCSNIGATKVIKNRQVRIVTVFLQSILKQRVMDSEDISHSIRQFCVEHNDVPGTQNLMREIIQYSAMPKSTNNQAK